MSAPVIAAAMALVAVATILAGFWAFITVVDPLEAAQQAGPELQHDTGETRAWVTALEGLAAPADPDVEADLQETLVQAGHRSPGAYALFNAVRALLTLGLPIPVALYLSDRPWTWQAAGILVAGGTGYFLPLWIARFQRGQRQYRIKVALPNMMDMLVTSVEAGLGIDAALNYAGREIGGSSHDLSDELEIANAEMSAGIPRMDALRNLERRCGVDELTALVNVIGQAERYGAGVASSLRAQAQLMRKRRALNAEERAAQASPKLTVAMILFILPALFVVILGPSYIHVTQGMVPFLGGGP